MRGRVRWGNVGRAAGAVAAVALVVAWPRLGGGAVMVPGGEAVPLAGPGAPAPPGSPPAPRRPAPALPAAPPRQGPAQLERVRRKPDRRTRDRPPEPRPAARAPPPAPRVDPPPEPPPAPRVSPEPAARPPAPTIDPAEREFGFER